MCLYIYILEHILGGHPICAIFIHVPTYIHSYIHVHNHTLYTDFYNNTSKMNCDINFSHVKC